MNEKTEATTATFLQTLRELSESRKTGTAMGSTNENRFFRLRMQEGLITHFVYGREYGVDAAERFTFSKTVHFSFSDDLDIPFPSKSGVSTYDRLELIEVLHLSLPSSDQAQDAPKKVEKAVTYRGQKKQVQSANAAEPEADKTRVYRGQGGRGKSINTVDLVERIRRKKRQLLGE
ncbi:MAG TPA: hypothetical protein DCZ12_14010 [Gammaproteobacteria bacterium]|jgi:hypothetical protein|nr:hypothetical protein [Gammaproteobacteria bacterium]HCO60322.1 hypothetical protein [Porticoccaceae bacterium]